MDHQPVSTVAWVHRDRLAANNYNPNHVAPVEMELLKISIMEDGWTQPIVVRPIEQGQSDMFEIVDGFHRWLTSADPEVQAKWGTGCLVPVVVLPYLPPDQQRMSTIRHNRARGSHGVLKMAAIVRELHDKFHLSFQEIEQRLGMEDEEVERLYDASGMTERGAGEEFGKGWVPNE